MNIRYRPWPLRVVLGLVLTACTSSPASSSSVIRDSEEMLRWLDEHRAQASAALAAGDAAAATRIAEDADARVLLQTDQKLACLSLEAGDARALKFFIRRAKQAQPEHVLPRFPCYLPGWAKQMQREDLAQLIRDEGVTGFENAIPYADTTHYQPGTIVTDHQGRYVTQPRTAMMVNELPYLPPEHFHLQTSDDTTAMTATANDTSLRLQTLDILSVGLSVEVLRQGKVWEAVKSAPDFHSNVLPPKDSDLWSFSDDLYTSSKREADTLELVLQNMVEAWPIPAVAVYDTETEGFHPNKEYWEKEVLHYLRSRAGMHWSQIKQLGAVYSDTPEGVVESIFRTFERYPDMPALLVFVEGPGGQSNANRRLDGPMESYAAMIVARRERVEWLRSFARYTDYDPKDSIYPGFSAWKKAPPKSFKATPFFPEPWTDGHFKQWDALPTLARLHRPVFVKLTDDQGAPLKRKAQDAALQAGWQQEMGPVAPVRVFFDGGKPGIGMARLAPVLTAANADLDLADPKEGIDLASRLGDTGAASPFVGLALAAMATAETHQPSAVVPLRREDEATFFLLTPADSNAKPDFTPKLRPQEAQGPDVPVSHQRPPEPKWTPYGAGLTSIGAFDESEQARWLEGNKGFIDRFIASMPPAPGEDD